MSQLMPLYYAIMKQFLDGREYAAEDIVAALRPLYNGYKLLTVKDVAEALATAKENGLLDESSYGVDDTGGLKVFFRVTDFGRDMIDRYIGKYSNPG